VNVNALTIIFGMPLLVTFTINIEPNYVICKKSEMKKLLLLFYLSVLFSCSESVIEQSESGQTVPDEWRDVVTDASGREYPFLDPTVVSYCGPGWGRKMCRFLDKYEGQSGQMQKIIIVTFQI